MPVSRRNRYCLQLGRSTMELGDRTLVMGILNTTPDSFSDGGKFEKLDAAVSAADRMILSGVDIIDIGGESTRPFSDPVSVDVELERVVPLIEAIRRKSMIPISIDTTKSDVARQALMAGANIINDVSALQFDDRMAELAAETGVPVILMHMLGTPRTMQQAPQYRSLFSEIISFLEQRIQYAEERGVIRTQIIVDPGIGFGKTVSQNLLLVRDLHMLMSLDRPILLGTSRKRYIGSILATSTGEREIGTAVAHAFGIAAGAHIIRVHDTDVHVQVAIMADALRNGTTPLQH